MYFYQLKVVIDKKNLGEFIDSLDSLSAKFRKEQGCIDFSMYKDVKKKQTFSLVGEWKTEKAMDKHFKSKDFLILVGAARVLGKDIVLTTGETSETGNIKLIRKKTTFQPLKNKEI
jgi:quinol monooxygenase YgiN